MTRQTPRFSRQNLGSVVAKPVAIVRGFATEFRDTKTRQNPEVASTSQKSQFLRRAALGHAASGSGIQMAFHDTTVWSTQDSAEER